MTTPAFQTANGLAPEELSKGMPVRLAFDATPNPIAFDLTKENSDGIISFVQAAWIDNRNAGILTINIPILGQILTIKGETQGVYPIYSITPFSMIASHVTANAVVNMILLNMPQPYIQWATA